MNKKNTDEKILILCRGIPGTGKSTLAQKLVGKGVIYETDDFFMVNGVYLYDINKAGVAHRWNQCRAKRAMKKGISPVVIANTNRKASEAEAYVIAAVQYGYKIKVREPNWNPKLKLKSGKWNVRLLKGKNIHNVPDEVVVEMNKQYEPMKLFRKNIKAIIKNDHLSKSTL